MNKKPIALIVFLTAILLPACAPSQGAIQTAIAGTRAVWTPIPTQTAYPTHTSYPTYTLQPTFFITKIVTETFSPTPIYTPTITPTPTKTHTAMPTTNPLTLPRGDGYYLVTVEIAPGLWRSQGTQNDCYWELSTRTGEIINNHFGMAGGTMYIPSSAFQVRLQDCGAWVYLGP
ncbi:MAG: hypothetical protein ABSG01_15630 [Anaerolineales bacterium]|jgi:hypothetical protein